MTHRPTLLGLAATLAMAGCASTFLGTEDLADRAAAALGLAAKDLSVSQRVDNGGSTRFVVRTPAGQEFHCSVGVIVNVLGRQVTDAVCTRRGEASRPSLTR